MDTKTPEETQLCLPCDMTPYLDNTGHLFNTNHAAVSMGMALPVNMDWAWLANQIENQIVRVFRQELPEGKPQFELAHFCTGYHIAADHYLFIFISDLVLRSHDLGWVRYFEIVNELHVDDGRIQDTCYLCKKRTPHFELQKPAYDVMKGKWGLHIYIMCQTCYYDSGV